MMKVCSLIQDEKDQQATADMLINLIDTIRRNNPGEDVVIVDVYGGYEITIPADSVRQY